MIYQRYQSVDVGMEKFCQTDHANYRENGSHEYMSRKCMELCDSIDP